MTSFHPPNYGSARRKPRRSRRGGIRQQAYNSRIKPPDSVSVGKHNGQKLAVGLGSARLTKDIIPFPQGRHRGRGDTAGKKRPLLDCACPPWREGQAGRWHGPCPDAGKPATGGIPAVSPRRTGCTVQADTASDRTPNTPHPSRGRRIAHKPGIASPDPVRQARSCQRGRGAGPLSRVGILALQGGEDVNFSAAYPWSSTTGQKLAVGLRSTRRMKAITPFRRGHLRSRGDTADKKRLSPVCACPA